MAFAQSKLPWYQTALTDAFLAALATRPAAALLTTPTLHLYSAVAGVLSPSKAVGDFTECTFNGYSAVVLAATSGPVNLPAGGGKGNYVNGLFTAGSGITLPGQAALGYWVDDGVSTVFLCEAFPTQINFVYPGDFLDMAVFWGQLYQVRIEN